MYGVIKAYKRFIKNYRTENGGINIYPEFDNDLNILLDFIRDEIVGLEEETSIGVWKPPYGEDD